MSAPVWLIAEREFRTYVATVSFWVALAIGPLFITGILFVTNNALAPIPIVVRATDPMLAKSAIAALAESASLEGRRYELVQKGVNATLTVISAGDGALDVDFSPGFPLSPSNQALIARTVERDEGLRRLAAAGGERGLILAHERTKLGPPPGTDADRVSRFGLMTLLWLTLTGSLGMLLQAVVRERANRALESLLAAARPWEIVAGKLAGVGAVSTVILVVWLGFAISLPTLGSTKAGAAAEVFQSLVVPTTLARAGLLYVLAYALYGFVTIAIGSMARDVASAQNLSRPMFAILLVAFFVALSTLSGVTASVSWLLYVPPFTPFLLLLRAPDEISAVSQLCAVAITLLATAAAGWWATESLTLTGASKRQSRLSST